MVNYRLSEVDKNKNVLEINGIDCIIDNYHSLRGITSFTKHFESSNQLKVALFCRGLIEHLNEIMISYNARHKIFTIPVCYSEDYPFLNIGYLKEQINNHVLDEELLAKIMDMYKYHQGITMTGYLQKIEEYINFLKKYDEEEIALEKELLNYLFELQKVVNLAINQDIYSFNNEKHIPMIRDRRLYDLGMMVSNHTKNKTLKK